VGVAKILRCRTDLFLKRKWLFVMSEDGLTKNKCIELDSALRKRIAYKQRCQARGSHTLQSG
jgi:hypothetical protein